MTERITEEQVSWFDQDTWFGKTCLEPLVPTAAKTSASSLKKSAKSQSRLPLFLDLRKNGEVQGASWVTGGLLLGEYMMHSFGESPSEENVSRLSQILEDCPLPKYSLSARACQGILNRAERRGKELPPELKEALIAQSVTDGLNQNTPTTTPETIAQSACKETESAELTCQKLESTVITARFDGNMGAAARASAMKKNAL